MFRRLALLALVGLATCGAVRAAEVTAADRIVLPDSVTPTHYALELTPDAAATTFSAVIRIQIEVHRATSDIQFNAGNLVFSAVKLSGMAVGPAISFDKELQTATLHFPRPVDAGRHLLSIWYSGHINATSSGLFFVDYDSDQGRRRALYTQFENAYARLLFPCWDEPNRKATFALTIIAPAAQMVVSNMPAVRTDQLAGGLARTRFQTTPRMSTYLLFVGIGDFERISRRVDGIEVGVVFKRGDTARARFALDEAAELLPYYESYFGIRYPLPKLDLVSGPGRSQDFGAMENWGAIFGFDRYFLVDPQSASQADTLNVYTFIAHEMAHLWFGDLVTMDWWNDLWLNEAFAEWMQYKATDHFHPEWNAWLLAVADRENAMHQDARSAGTHPIITPVLNALQADNDFDTITYDKGMAVVRMLEGYVGEDAFRKAIQRYLRAHAYGNAVTEDLWRELDRTAPQPVSTIAHEFTLQGGVPLIRVSAGAGLHLEQGRFAIDAMDPFLVWHVPVVAQAMDGTSWQGIVSAAAPADLKPLSPGGTVVNVGQVGYFRTQYAPELVTALAERFGSLHAVDQLGTLLDAEALGMAGYEPFPDVLELARRVDSASHPQVQRTVAAILTDLARLYRNRPAEATYQGYARSVVERMLAGTGWSPAAGERPEVGALRAALIQALGNLDDAHATDWARDWFASYSRDPQSVPAELRNVMLQVVAMHADAGQWSQLHTLAKGAHSGAQQDDLYNMLGLARDPQLAQQALDLTLTDEVELTVKPDIVSFVAIGHPEMAFDFAVAHRELVNTWVEPDVRDVFEARLLDHSVDPAALERLNTYIESLAHASDRKGAEVASARMRDNIKVRAERLPQIDAWLQSRRP